MSWKKIVTTLAFLSTCSTAYSAVVTNALELSFQLQASTPSITFGTSFTQGPVYPVNVNKDLTPNGIITNIIGAPYTLDGGGTLPGFFIGGGTAMISGLTFSDCIAVGGAGGPGGGGGGMGAGGAIYVRSGATAILNSCIIQNCSTTAGAGGVAGTNGGGGGGGGLYGSGNPMDQSGGGGGGGFYNNGGSGVSDGGGGGGGFLGAGGDGTGGNGGDGGENYATQSGGGGGASGGNDGGAGVNGGTGGGGGGSAGDMFTEVTGNGGPANTPGGGGGGAGGQAIASAMGATAGNGGSAFMYGGGGGGGVVASGMPGADCYGGNGGSGSFGAGGGGGGGAVSSGGGDFAQGGTGGIGGFGGGGGAGGRASAATIMQGLGVAGGFGATGGTNGSPAASGVGGTGASLGGGIFIEKGGTVTIQNSITLSGNTSAIGNDIFMMAGSFLNFELSTSLTLPANHPIASDYNSVPPPTSLNGQVVINNMSPSVFVNYGANLNTYVGTTVIQNGILEITLDANLGANGLAANNGLTFNTSTGGSPTLQVSTNTVALGINRPITFTGTGTSTILVPSGGLDVPNSFALSGTLNINPTTQATFSGAISGAGALTMSGTGILTFSGAANSYTGLTTISAGTVDLSKTTGPAIAGDISLQGGTLTITSSGGAMGQIGSASNMTISNGIFNMNSFPATFNSLTFDAGTISSQSANLTLLSNATALTMQDGTNIPGPGNLDLTHGGGVTFSPISTGIATITAPVNLEGNNVTFTVNPGTSPSAMMIINSAISNGMITLAGTGTLQFAGAAANTYSGTTTISSGTLELDKVPAAIAVPGDIVISGGTLLLQNSGQIATTSNMTINSGTFNMNGFSENINSLTYLGGSLTQAGGTLGLLSAGTALTIQGGLTISGPLNLTNGGNVVGPTNMGTATLSGPVTLGTGTNSWNISRGSNAFDMIVSGNLTGAGNLTKTGNGILNITSPASNYAGPTVVSSGTLAVNGSLTTPTTTVGPGATLQGTGTLTGNVEVQGFLSPGNSNGTFTINGNVLFDATSTHINEITPTTTDLLMVNGAVTILPGATFKVEPAMAVYSKGTRYEVISTTGGVTGTFTNFTTTFPIVYQLFYTAHDVFLEASITQLTNMIPSGNGQSVATALDQIFATGNSQDPIFAALFNVPPNELNYALNQMHSALFTAMSIVQQSNAVQVSSALSNRFQNVLDFSNCISMENCPEKTSDETMTEISEKKCNSCEPEKAFVHLWGDVFGDFIHQKRNHSSFSPQVAYGSSTAGAVSGIDFNFVKYLYIGALGAYTHSNVNWKHHQGKGHINSGYAGLYASGIGKMFYGNISVIRTWNRSDAHRNIIFTGTNQTARSKRNGSQVLSHADTGINIGIGSFSLRLFDAFDYITQQESSYKEHGADGFDLDVLGRTLRMYRNEAGINFASCFCSNSNKFVIDLKLSWINERRIKGKNTTARFNGTTPHFTVTNSNYCNRELLSPGLTLTYKFHNAGDLTAYYNGEFGRRYNDQSFGIQFGADF